MISNSAIIPLITLPTRVASATSTIIAHVITTDLKHKIVPFVIRSDLTDHCYSMQYKNYKSLHACKNNEVPFSTTVMNRG